jgi:crotonobetainyl-CoA:carnitine CoA-transferase CaiB-like acyl-CoA transferase
MPAPSAHQPLAGLRVVEFSHMVMGPTCGMVLADMGAEVIKVEPIDG